MARLLRAFPIVSGMVLASVLAVLWPQPGRGQATDERVICMAAIEPKGGATLDKEPFPATPLPKERAMS